MAKAIILAGGVGSRLWPLSREGYPKQFIKFFEGKSLFQKTIERLNPIFGSENLLISTSKNYRFLVQNQLDELNLDLGKNQIVAEPAARGTLSAILLSMHVGGHDDYGVFPSDHSMRGQDEFIESIKNAKKLSKNKLISFGIVPTHPHTGYGYIKPGKELNGGFEVDKFIEKPNYELAKKYVNNGYFWNAGMLYVNSKNFVKEVQEYSPEHLCIHERGVDDYESVKSMTLEYGVLEKTDKAVVVPITSKWNDLGSFSSFFDEMDKNGEKLVTNTEVLNLDSKNSLIWSESKKLIGLIDVDDLIVVDTRDALLISSKKSSQKVKKMVTFLKDNKDSRARFHTTVHRPWGYFIMMEDNGGYRIRRMFVRPGKRLTAQKHFNRSEHWVVVKGTARVYLDGVETILGPGESSYVHRGTSHRIENPGQIPLEMIEVQIGDYISEKDVERIDNDKIEE